MISETANYWMALVVFLLVYAGLALGRVPGLRVDRAGIALVGAAAVLNLGLLSFPEAVQGLDHATLVLLFGLMVVVGYLHLAGGFTVLANGLLRGSRQPLVFLAGVVFLSGVLSAFLVNDVICLALTPLVIHLCRRWHWDPRPHLLALATASNLGSTATITGNPQNMIIGSFAQIPYGRFLVHLAPVALVGLLVDWGLLAWLYRHQLQLRELPRSEEKDLRKKTIHERRRRRRQRGLLGKGLVVTVLMVLLFLLGLPTALVALGAAAVLLLDRLRPAKLYRQIDWSLLVLFAGLFVVVRAFAHHVVQTWELEHWPVLQQHPLGLLSLVAALLSNLVSNVPAVLLFQPIIPVLPTAVQERAWLELAMSSTLAGNLTVLGSVANLIVLESARREGVPISFGEYCRLGIPLTFLTLALGVGWLWVTA